MNQLPKLGIAKKLSNIFLACVLAHEDPHDERRKRKRMLALVLPQVKVMVLGWRFLHLVDPGEQAVGVLRVTVVPGTENFPQVCFLQANPPPNQKNRDQ